MGTWGPGNLQNDTALDDLGDRSQALIASLWTRLRSQTGWEADEYDHCALFVDLEWALALDAADVLDGHTLPTPAELDPVLATWMAGWDAYLDQLQPRGDFKARRREVIEATFTRLRAACAKHEARRA